MLRASDRPFTARYTYSCLDLVQCKHSTLTITRVPPISFRSRFVHSDDVLSEYVIVMLAHGKTFEQVLSDLDAFLGDKAEKFTHWLSHNARRIA